MILWGFGFGPDRIDGEGRLEPSAGPRYAVPRSAERHAPRCESEGCARPADRGMAWCRPCWDGEAHREPVRGDREGARR